LIRRAEMSSIGERKRRNGGITELTTTAADGTTVRALDEGRGPVILILHPGMETGTRYGKVSRLLSDRFRVVRLHRRQYRLDLKEDPKVGSPCTVGQEVEHVLAIVREVGAPVVLYGHSSGGPVALEALVASPSSFSGAVIYEPASVIGPPGGLHLCGDALPRDGDVGEGLKRARAALVDGKPGKALGIFFALVASSPRWVADLVGPVSALFPAYRRLIPCQIDDLEAMERLGVRLDAYSEIRVPTVILDGDRSPAFIREIVAAVCRAMPAAEHVVLRGQGHTAHVSAPGQVALAIAGLAARVVDQA
jgi:pimeloyl-ACP methyl ester carboxylesterase